MCAHGSPPVNSFRNIAAVIDAAGAAAGVHHVGDLALQLIAVLVEERHRPHAIAGAVGRRGAPARPTQSGVPNSPLVILPERDDAGAGERRDVHQMRRAELPRVPERVAEDQPALGVGVDHLDRLAAPRSCRMSPGLIARPPGMFSVVGTTPMTRIGALQQRDGAHRARHRRAAGHVVLHPLHALGRLDRDAAGVERDALADQAEDRRRRRAGRVVAEHHQPRRLAAAARDAEQQAHAERFDLASRRGPRPTTPPSVASAAARARELARRQRVARLVGELARQVAALAEQASAIGRATDARQPIGAKPPAPRASTPECSTTDGRSSCRWRRRTRRASAPRPPPGPSLRSRPPRTGPAARAAAPGRRGRRGAGGRRARRRSRSCGPGPFRSSAAGPAPTSISRSGPPRAIDNRGQKQVKRAGGELRRRQRPRQLAAGRAVECRRVCRARRLRTRGGRSGRSRGCRARRWCR